MWNAHKLILLVMLIIVIGGVASVRYSRAATAVLSVEPENGVLTGQAALVMDTVASGGKAVRFMPTVSINNTWPNQSLYTEPNSYASMQAQQWASSRPADAAIMTRLAGQPVFKWFGNWNTNVQADANNYVSAAAAAGRMPLLVTYNIPNRDCGNYSAGGATGATEYNTWIQSLANGINNRPAIVVLEPDALGVISCLSQTDLTARYQMIARAVTTLKLKGAIVYIDASHFVAPADMAARLNQAGIADAAGFSLNVSNYQTTANMTTFGNQVSASVGNKHFIIDTSRNGNGPTIDDQWCNPPGRALGVTPTTSAPTSKLVDGYLWIKRVGESDGNCNGGPSAGQWWADYALNLAKAAGW